MVITEPSFEGLRNLAEGRKGNQKLTVKVYCMKQTHCEGLPIDVGAIIDIINHSI